MVDYGDYPSYQHLYAQLVIQAHRDLDLPVRRLFSKDKQTGEVVGLPWWEALGGHLEALKLDAHFSKSKVQIPSIGEAVGLWSMNKLDTWCIVCPEKDSVQLNLNSFLSQRLDGVFFGGDPCLTAVMVTTQPQQLKQFAFSAGLNDAKAEEVCEVIHRIALPIAKELWANLSKPFNPIEALVTNSRYENQRNS